MARNLKYWSLPKMLLPNNYFTSISIDASPNAIPLALLERFFSRKSDWLSTILSHDHLGPIRAYQYSHTGSGIRIEPAYHRLAFPFKAGWPNGCGESHRVDAVECASGNNSRVGAELDTL